MLIDTPRTGKIALSIAILLGGVLIAKGDPFLMVLLSPAVASPLSLAIVVFVSWLLGAGRRSYLYGTGRQLCWAYLGHTIRGHRDAAQKLWISLSDCHCASGINLLARLDRIADYQKQKDNVKGWLVTQAGMIRVLDSLRGNDPFLVHKLRLFLEREVWQVRRG